MPRSYRGAEVTQMEQAHVVLGEGSQVVVGQVDMQGFLGRDFHPERKDEGAVGYVVKAHIEFYGDRDACPEIPLVRDAYGGEILGEDEVAVYRVGTRDGRILELVNHELAD